MRNRRHQVLQPRWRAREFRRVYETREPIEELFHVHASTLSHDVLGIRADVAVVNLRECHGGVPSDDIANLDVRVLLLQFFADSECFAHILPVAIEGVLVLIRVL